MSAPRFAAGVPHRSSRLWDPARRATQIEPLRPRGAASVRPHLWQAGVRPASCSRSCGLRWGCAERLHAPAHPGRITVRGGWAFGGLPRRTHASAEGCGHLDISVQLIAESSGPLAGRKRPVVMLGRFSAYASTTPGAARGSWQRWRRSHASEWNDASARAGDARIPRQTSACIALSARSPWTTCERLGRRPPDAR